MPLAEALSINPGLSVHEQDAEADLRALEELTKLGQRYSPIVGIEEGPTPQSLLLDLTGCAACFGGEDQLLERAERDFAEQGWVVRLAIADTLGAAWGLSRYVAKPCLVPPGATEPALAPLPTAALRLPSETLDLLAALGVKRVRDLMALPRDGLASRFGSLVLRRLDQALGRLPEVLIPHRFLPEVQAGLNFDYPTDRLEVLHQVLDQLTEEIYQALRRRNWGARQVKCTLYHEAAPPVTVEVGLYRPSRCPRYLATLVRTRLEQVRLAEPICAMRLSVPMAETLPETQGEMFDSGRYDEESLHLLIDRLSSRLGREAVARPLLIPDPQPEFTYRFEPLVRCEGRGVRVEGRGTRDKKKKPLPLPRPSSLAPRPLTLWPQPVPVEALAVTPDGPPLRFRWAGADFQVARWWGPERIETGWWRGDDVRRDYYVVTTHLGSRFWLYRRHDDGRWFLHGCFD
jgi:protein ImuB